MVSHFVIRRATTPDRDMVLRIAAAGMQEFGLVPDVSRLDALLAFTTDARAAEWKLFASSFVGGISSRPQAADAARDLIAFLKSPAAVRVMCSQGMEPLF